MKNYLLAGLPLLFFLFSFGPRNFEPRNFSPEFPGGDTALICFYKSNLPAGIVNDPALRGDYMVTFLVDTAGHVKDAKISRSPAQSEKAQTEIIRVTNMLPKWKPGYNTGDIYTDEESSKKVHPRSAQLNYLVRLPQVDRAVCPGK